MLGTAISNQVALLEAIAVVYALTRVSHAVLNASVRFAVKLIAPPGSFKPAISMCYRKGFLSSTSYGFPYVQHIFSTLSVVAASWWDYIFSPTMRCPWLRFPQPSVRIGMASRL